MEAVFFVKLQSAVLNFCHLTSFFGSFAKETKKTEFSVKSSGEEILYMDFFFILDKQACANTYLED